MKDTRRPTLLLVDDNKRLVITLTDFLEYEGYNVVSAANGEVALEKLRHIKPDMIILDINMPGIGGIGFLHNLQANNIHPDCPILVFTARSAMEEFMRSLDVAGFISKPCSQSDLLHKIQDVLTASNDSASASGSEPKVITVLIGEDDEVIAERLSLNLRQKGLNFRIVSSGGEIVETAAVLKPDAIVLKDILPGMNGRVVVPLLRAMPSTKNTPIILYDDTRSTEDDNRYGRRVPEGVSDYLNTSEAPAIVEALSKFL